MAWLTGLPQELEEEFREQVTVLEEKGMPYVTSWERRGMRLEREELVWASARTESRHAFRHRLDD